MLHSKSNGTSDFSLALGAYSRPVVALNDSRLLFRNFQGLKEFQAIEF